MRFRPVRLRTGYDTDEVDHYLDRLADELRRREGPPTDAEPVRAAGDLGGPVGVSGGGRAPGGRRAGPGAVSRRHGRRSRPAAGCCTSTSTSSSPPSRCCAGPSSPACRWSSAAAGDPTERGVVSTASYEARAFGVGSGMPLRTAARKVPDAVFLPVDHAAYDAASAAGHGHAARARRAGGGARLGRGVPGRRRTDDPEAFAAGRAGGRARRHPAALLGRHRRQQAAGQDRHRLRQATRGRPADHRDLVRRDGRRGRPTRCGASAARPPAKLAELGIHTVSELAATETQVLADRLGPTMGPWYRRLGRGVDSSPGRRDAVRRARARPRDDVPAEPRPTGTRSPTRCASSRPRSPRTSAPRGGPRSGSAMKLRYAPFETRTRSLTLPGPTSDGAGDRRRGAGAARPLRPRPGRSGWSACGRRWNRRRTDSPRGEEDHARGAVPGSRRAGATATLVPRWWTARTRAGTSTRPSTSVCGSARCCSPRAPARPTWARRCSNVAHGCGLRGATADVTFTELAMSYQTSFDEPAMIQIRQVRHREIDYEDLTLVDHLVRDLLGGTSTATRPAAGWPASCRRGTGCPAGRSPSGSA